ncbi:hypothetical protein V7D15_12515, partial [Thermoanaerobacter thermohydrosulfuricus]
WLVVPTTKPTADFHRLVIAHAGRTYRKAETVRFCLKFIQLLNAKCVVGVFNVIFTANSK